MAKQILHENKKLYVRSLKIYINHLYKHRERCCNLYKIRNFINKTWN